MPNIILRPSFSKDLDGLRHSSRKAYQRASEILLEIQRDVDRPVSSVPATKLSLIITAATSANDILRAHATSASHPLSDHSVAEH